MNPTRTSLLLFALTLTACDLPSPTQNTGAVTPAYKVRSIDGCEYIEVDQGIFDHRVYSLTHKGDCKNPIHQQQAAALERIAKALEDRKP